MLIFVRWVVTGSNLNCWNQNLQPLVRARAPPLAGRALSSAGSIVLRTTLERERTRRVIASYIVWTCVVSKKVLVQEKSLSHNDGLISSCDEPPNERSGPLIPYKKEKRGRQIKGFYTVSKRITAKLF